MRSNNKLILRAKIEKQITEYYELDCTGMCVDQIEAEMHEAYPEGRDGWHYVKSETDHHEIETKLEIVENHDA